MKENEKSILLVKYVYGMYLPCGIQENMIMKWNENREILTIK
jgi:hypothetical protein